MTQLDLFPDINVDERERLYVIGNGFDLHHEIESKYWHFKNGVKIIKRIRTL